MTYRILAISGSLRKASTNTGLLRAFSELAPEGVAIELFDIAGLPLFDQDDEFDRYPALAAELKQRVRDADGVLIATPEYNRGTTPALKNAIDWSTRPEGDSPWAGKPVYLVGASSGTLGTTHAQYDLKRTFTYLNASVLGQPEFYVTFNKKKFDEHGNLTDEDTNARIGKAISAFIEHIDRVR
jgi:chromate reductase